MGAAELGRLSLPPVPPVAVLCTKQLFKAAFPMHHDQKKLVRTQPKPVLFWSGLLLTSGLLLLLRLPVVRTICAASSA